MTETNLNNTTPLSIKEEIEKSLRFILTEGQVTELRAIEVNDDHSTAAGYFDDPQKMAEAAAKLTEFAKGVYFIPNPISPDLLGRINNRIKRINSKKDPLTGNSNIIARKWLLIDTDCIRPANITATIDQADLAMQKARDIREFLNDQGWPDPIVGFSGNGGHLMYRIEIPADDEGLIKGVLEGLSFEFDDDFVNVDTTVQNSARLWKLYGTYAKKGDEVPKQDRLHRQALIDWHLTPDTLGVVSKEQLQEIARIKPKEEHTIVKDVYKNRKFNLEGWIEMHDLKVYGHKVFPGSKGKDAGESWSFEHCPFSEEHADGAKLIRYSSGAVAAYCYHNSCKGMAWEDLRDLVEPNWREKKNADEETAGGYGPMFVFQDAINGSYMIDDQYGLRSMDKTKLKDMVYGETGRRLGRLNRYRQEYVPEEETGYIPEYSAYNSWKLSPVQAKAKELIDKGMTWRSALRKAPLFRATIKHMFPDKSHCSYFLDFLAATIQGYKLNVGIVLNDKGGTGKTLVLEYMLSEFLDGNYQKFTRRHLKDMFNDWMAGKQLLFGDEIAINRDNRSEVEDFLKDFVTGRKQPIRGMRENWMEVSNRANMIIASNKNTPIYIDDVDRRWNFFNPGKINIKDGKRSWHLVDNPAWKKLNIKSTVEGKEKALSEAVYMGVYLYLRKPDLNKLTTVIMTSGKEDVIEFQRDRFTEFAFRIQSQDYEWIQENSDNKAFSEVGSTYAKDRLIACLKGGIKHVIIDDLYKVFNLIYTDTKIAKPTFTKKMVETTWLFRSEKRQFIKDYQGHGKQAHVLEIQSS